MTFGSMSHTPGNSKMIDTLAGFSSFEGPFSVFILKYSALTLDQSALLLSVIFDSYHKALITRTGF